MGRPPPSCLAAHTCRRAESSCSRRAASKSRRFTLCCLSGCGRWPLRAACSARSRCRSSPRSAVWRRSRSASPPRPGSCAPSRTTSAAAHARSGRSTRRRPRRRPRRRQTAPGPQAAAAGCRCRGASATATRRRRTRAWWWRVGTWHCRTSASSRCRTAPTARGTARSCLARQPLRCGRRGTRSYVRWPHLLTSHLLLLRTYATCDLLPATC